MPGQHRARQIIEPDAATVATIALAMRLGVVMPITYHRPVAAIGAARTIRPAMPADQLKALRVIDQGRQVDQLGSGHGTVSSGQGNQP